MSKIKLTIEYLEEDGTSCTQQFDLTRFNNVQIRQYFGHMQVPVNGVGIVRKPNGEELFAIFASNNTEVTDNMIDFADKVAQTLSPTLF